MKGKKLNLVGRVFLSGLGLFGVVKLANASTLSNFLDANDVSIQNSSSELTHHTIPELFEATFIDGWTPAVDIFYRRGNNKKKGIGESSESMETETAYIAGRDLSGSTACELGSDISEASWGGGYRENNMIGKKVIGNLYQRVDDGQGGFNYNHVGTYNLWNMHESGQKINLTVSEGITRGEDFYPSHKLEISFSYNNVADFDNGGDVNFEDFAMLTNDWKKPIGNYLTDISGPEGLSDGVINEYDLAEFIANWLQRE